MLHEVFLSLLGFTGDIIVEGENTYLVSPSFDLFTAAEKQQINRIVPLGWYYASLSSFVVLYEVKWGVKIGDPDSQFYRTAMSQGIADLLSEYADDIAYLEQLVLAEGPVPLSHVLHHLQKYLLIMPVIHSMWIEVEKKKIWGCQLLDFIKSKRSGMPVVDDIVQRMMIKVRAVFLKQCLAWMLYGELEDPAEEFFIQSRGIGMRGGDSNSGLQHEEQQLRAEMLNRFGSNSDAMWSSATAEENNSSKADHISFDWNTSFSLRLELLPESHVSPRIASKIIFCGKAVKLLLSANKTANAADMPQLRDIFTYLSTGPSPSSGTTEVRRDTSAQSGGAVLSNRKKTSTSPALTTTDGDGNNSNNGNFTPLKKGVVNQKNEGINEDEETPSEPFAEHFERCGFERNDIERFTACFLKVLMEPHLALQSFESLVEDVHSLLSSKLWTLLRDQFGFTNFLLSIRNTYLMGKGELYQLILDGVLEQTHKPAPDSQKADNVLKWDIIRGAGKTLNLDDDSLASTIAIRVNISSLTITDFNAQSCTVCIAGGAQYELSKPVAIGKKRINRYVSLCTIIEEDSSAELSKLWSTHVLRKSSDLGIKDPGSRHTGPIGAESTPEKGISSDVKAGSARAKYTQGAVWLPDQKYVAKGFTVNSVFECDWLSVRNSVTLSHPNIVNSTPTIVTDDSEHLQIACCERSILSAAESLQVQAQALSAPASKGKSDPSSVSLGGGRNDPGPVPITPKGSKPSRIRRGANGHLLLGGLSCVVHSDRQGTRALGSGDLGLDLSGVVTVGVSFHAHIVEDRRSKRAQTASSQHFSNNNTNGGSTNNSSSSSSSSRSVQSYARVFISVKGDHRSRFSRSHSNLTLGSSVGAGGSTSQGGDGVSFADSEGSDSSVVAECFIDIDRNTGLGGDAGHGIRGLSSAGSMFLEVEYSRELLPKGGVGVRASMTSASLGGKLSGTAPQATPAGTGLVVFKLRGRLRDGEMQRSEGGANQGGWDVEASVDLTNHLKLQGGQAFVGFVGSGMVFSEGLPHSQTERISIGRQLFSQNTSSSHRNDTASKSNKSGLPTLFGVRLASFDFSGKGALATYPVASLFTSSRYPDTFLSLEREVSQFRAWMNLKLSFHFPALFKIIFDSEAMSAYERLFTTIMKVRLVAHALEGLWRTISRSQLKGDRVFCQIRHSMHFFITNLLFHLQVDVVDSEFCILLEETSSACDFQTVLRAHRSFIATVMRLSSVDNLLVQEGIERVLQVCLRFIAVCRLLHQQEGEASAPNTPRGLRHMGIPRTDDKEKRAAPVVIPSEEIEGVRREFFTQISYLFQIMRKVENRGLMFRLDFNGYLSALAEEMGAGLER